MVTEIKRQLIEWGADPESAIGRMMDDEVFYREMLDKFADEAELTELGNIARRDPKEGFRVAHSLKRTPAKKKIKKRLPARGAVAFVFPSESDAQMPAPRRIASALLYASSFHG